MPPHVTHDEGAHHEPQPKTEMTLVEVAGRSGYKHGIHGRRTYATGFPQLTLDLSTVRVAKSKQRQNNEHNKLTAGV